MIHNNSYNKSNQTTHHLAGPFASYTNTTVVVTFDCPGGKISATVIPSPAELPPAPTFPVELASVVCNSVMGALVNK
jgi:hypothetical protein